MRDIDYRIIAGEIAQMVAEKKASKDEASVSTLTDLADNLAVALAQDDPHFDKRLFFWLCGVDIPA